jgi:hydroxyacylglutathione hydrolase
MTLKSKPLKIIVIIGLILVLLVGLLYFFRFNLIATLIKLEGPAPLKDQSEFENSNQVQWYDDYYTVEHIDSRTIAIGEPRYHQMNYNYLIIGKSKAVLLDTGPGVRNIIPVAKSLISVPLVVTVSHLHYDHIGNLEKLDNIAMVDLPGYRERVNNSGSFTSMKDEHLGYIEDISIKSFTIKYWWKPGNKIDLGDRMLEVIHTPGHSKDSVSFLDRDANFMFTGDFFCSGLFAFLPHSDMDAYLQSIDNTLNLINKNTILLGAHGKFTKSLKGPRHTYQDMLDLKKAFLGIQKGEIQSTGLYPRIFKINDSIELWADAQLF